MRRFWNLIIFAAIALGPLQGQVLQTAFETIRLENGNAFPNVSISAIGEDATGFMWFGTANGLIRYDGYTTLTFTHNDEDTSSLPDDRINGLFCDRRGTFWVGTAAGLCKYIPDNHSFPMAKGAGLDRPPRLLQLWEDCEGTLWASGADGLMRYDPAKDLFIPLPLRLDGSKDFEMHPLRGTCDRYCNFWMISHGKFFRVNLADSTATSIPIPKELEGPRGPEVHRLFADSRGEIWIKGRPGLMVYSPAKDLWRRIALPDSLGYRLSRCAVEDAWGRVWAGFRFNGLVRCDPDGANHVFRPDPADPFGVFSNRIFELFIDHNQNLWVGTYKGIQKCRLNNPFQFYQNTTGFFSENNFCSDFLEDGSGKCWIGTAEQLMYSERLGAPSRSIPIFLSNLEESDLIFYKKIPPGYTRNKDAKVFYRDHEGVLWIGGTLGLYKVNPGQTIVCVPIDTTADQQEVYAIGQHPDQKEYLWLLYRNALLKYHKSAPHDTTWIPLPKGLGTATQMVVTAEGNLWIGTGRALVYFNENKHQFTVLPFGPRLPIVQIISMIEYPRNQLILGTNQGLFICPFEGIQIPQDTSRLQFKQLLPDANDPGNRRINTLIPDNLGRLWFTTYDALQYLDLNTGFIRTFKVGRSPIAGFAFDASCRLLDGRLAIGGINGIWAFDPDKIGFDTSRLSIVLTQVSTPQGLTLSESPETIRKITLPPLNDVITLQWAALYPTESAQVRYTYLLEGYTDDWSTPGSARAATFSNLSPGTYTLRVRADRGDGQWSPHELQVTIRLLPKWWQTMWFRVFIGLCLAGVAYAIWRYRRYNQFLREQKAVAEQSARYKSQFLANMSHEIRTPMNAIVGLNKLLLDSDLNHKQKEYTEAIEESAEQLLWIVNDILDQAKIESGKYSFSLRPFELDTITRYLERIFAFRAHEKHLDFDIAIAPEVPNRLVGDPIRLNQILTNLLGNALKFTDKGGITLEIAPAPNAGNADDTIRLRFTVTDTGIGIPPVALQRIFESFEQVDGDEHPLYRQGTGLGLSIVKQLVEQQRGTIAVESKPGEGSVFKVELPFVPVEEAASASVLSLHKELPDTATLRGLKILLVEDVYFNQMLARELLQKHLPEVSIDIAENGQIAVEKVQQHDYDLVLMDVKMPVMDGYAATQAIRNLPDDKFRRLPILALTANAVPEQIERCRTAGMDDCVTKPLQTEELLAKILELMGRARG